MWQGEGPFFISSESTLVHLSVPISPLCLQHGPRSLQKFKILHLTSIKGQTARGMGKKKRMHIRSRITKMLSVGTSNVRRQTTDTWKMCSLMMMVLYVSMLLQHGDVLTLQVFTIIIYDGHTLWIQKLWFQILLWAATFSPKYFGMDRPAGY